MSKTSSKPAIEPIEEFVPADDTIIGSAFRWSMIALVIIAAIVALTLWFMREEPEPEVIIAKNPTPPAPLVQETPQRQAVRFVDVTTGAGIDFVHVTGARGDRLLPETMGGGNAWLDFDNDGDQDLLLVNSTYWPEDQQSGDPPTMALYENDGTGHFTNITTRAGLDVSFYGMGVAVADYDADGDTDVFFTAVGSNHLFRNDGGRFSEVTDQAGVGGAPDAWSSSAGFFDYDNDGDLDLMVCNYVKWSREIDLQLDFQLAGLGRAYGPPTIFEGANSYLYRNEGNGRFMDVSSTAGIHVQTALGKPKGKALALCIADFDGDSLIDVIVANDTVQNFFFHNTGDPVRPFEEIGAESGVAFNAMGGSTGAMGIDVGDVRNNQWLAVGIGNFANEASSLYVQQDRALVFADVSSVEGIASPSRLRLSFGLFFFDYDLDGRLDMLQANGHLEPEINRVQVAQNFRQPAQLFWNCGPGSRSCFAAVDEADMGDLAEPIVGRGASFADIDNDGDLDVLITQTGDRPVLMRNDQALGHHWLRVKLRGAGGNRDAIGAWIELTSGGITQRRQVMPTRSYLSQAELPVTFGLGKQDSIESVLIRWPDGTEQALEPPAVDTIITVEQTSG